MLPSVMEIRGAGERGMALKGDLAEVGAGAGLRGSLAVSSPRPALA
jgi:hypothetical protein